MRLLGLFLVIILMTACGQGDSKKEEAADPAKVETTETPAETAPSEEGGSTPETNDSGEAPDVLTTPPEDK